MKLVPLNSASITTSENNIKRNVIETKKSPSVSDHIVAGSIALSAVALPSACIKLFPAKKFNNRVRQLEKHNDSYKTLINDALECTGLKNKFVRIQKAQDFTEKYIDEICEK